MNVEIRDEGRCRAAELLEYESDYDGTRLLRGIGNAIWMTALIWIVLCIGAFLVVGAMSSIALTPPSAPH